jgi:lipoprotein-releasing system ATP-binding protein
MEIKVENLAKVYRDAEVDLCIIQNLTFSFPHGQSIAIVGNSGIGKSTLLHMIGGLDKPTSGIVRYGSLDITSLKGDEISSFRGSKIGFIFQFHHLLPEFTALENVALPRIIAGADKEEAETEARSLLELVKLKHRLSHLPGKLSGGEQQRVAIARALINKPPVMLADEPTGSLDIATADEVHNLLLDINRKFKSTLIVVTHNRELALKMNIVLEMHQGGTLTCISQKN